MLLFPLTWEYEKLRIESGEASTMVNEKLRAARKEKRWTIAVAAEKARVSWLTFSRWENGTQKPYLSTLDQLCEAFGKTPQELGFSELVEESAGDGANDNTLTSTSALASRGSPIITLTGNEAAALLSLLGDDMAQFDETKRATLRALLKMAGSVGITLAISQNFEPWERLTAAAKKPTSIDAATLEHFAKINQTCWELTNGTGIKAINQLLPTYLPYLPQLSTIAHQSSSYRSFAASLAAQGYLLTGLVALDKYNLPEMEKSSQSAIQYSQ